MIKNFKKKPYSILYSRFRSVLSSYYIISTSRNKNKTALQLINLLFFFTRKSIHLRILPCLIILSNKLMVLWPVPCAGRARTTSKPRSDPTDTSPLALAPSVINYSLPFILLFHPNLFKYNAPI